MFRDQIADNVIARYRDSARLDFDTQVSNGIPEKLAYRNTIEAWGYKTWKAKDVSKTS